jgi:hypothetical protein
MPPSTANATNVANVANVANRPTLAPAPHRVSPYKLARVEKVDMPDGGRGQHWYRYVLNNGRSTITGQRRGSLKDVTMHAHRYAEQLNTRAFGSHSVWSARRTDPKANKAR